MHSVCSLQPEGGHRRAPSCLAAIAISDELLRRTRKLVPPARARTRKRPRQATSRHPGGPRWRRHRREPLGASWSRIAPSNPPGMRFRALEPQREPLRHGRARSRPVWHRFLSFFFRRGPEVLRRQPRAKFPARTRPCATRTGSKGVESPWKVDRSRTLREFGHASSRRGGDRVPREPHRRADQVVSRRGARRRFFSVRDVLGASSASTRTRIRERDRKKKVLYRVGAVRGVHPRDPGARRRPR